MSDHYRKETNKNKKIAWETPSVLNIDLIKTQSGAATQVPERFTGYPTGTPFGGS